MGKIDPIVRLSADEKGIAKCVVFVDSVLKARQKMGAYGTIVGAYPFISAFGALVNVDKLADLAQLGCVKSVAGHTTVTACMPPLPRFGGRKIMSQNTAVSDEGKSEDIYKALRRLHARQIDGRGITCAVIDTGARLHLDFCMPKHRLLFRDFTDDSPLAYDDNGHGTAVASILGGNGLTNGQQTGAAPHCRIAALKAVGANGEGGAFKILEAMQWVHSNRKDLNIRVVNLSLGAEPLSGADPLALGAEALWKSGITVVASAGNSGPNSSTIKSPGISPYIITVGCARRNEAGIWSAADFSSRGPAGQFSKPDLLAPGVNVTAAGIHEPYATMSGTSMAAPLVAGMCALILQAKPKYTPDRVKEFLLEGASKLDCVADTCGRGLISPHSLMQLL